MDPAPTVRPNAGDLMPLVYDELRRLAAAHLAREKPGQTLEPTALVHEAFLRLVHEENRNWVDSKHFFCAAATAMRRILIDTARNKSRIKRGGLLERVELSETALGSSFRSEELLALDEALERLASIDPEAARLVELRHFIGLGHQEAARVLGISRRTADGLWAYARAWLLVEMRHEPGQTQMAHEPGNHIPVKDRPGDVGIPAG